MKIPKILWLDGQGKEQRNDCLACISVCCLLSVVKAAGVLPTQYSLGSSNKSRSRNKYTLVLPRFRTVRQHDNEGEKLHAKEMLPNKRLIKNITSSHLLKRSHRHEVSAWGIETEHPDSSWGSQPSTSSWRILKRKQLLNLCVHTANTPFAITWFAITIGKFLWFVPRTQKRNSFDQTNNSSLFQKQGPSSQQFFYTSGRVESAALCLQKNKPTIHKTGHLHPLFHAFAPQLGRRWRD